MEHKHLPHDHGRDTAKILHAMPPTGDFNKVADVFSLLGDGTRLKIFWLLCHSEECVCNIAAAIGMSAPAVSHHLRSLKQSGLITSRRLGKETHYTLNNTEEAELTHRMVDAMFRIKCPRQN